MKLNTKDQCIVNMILEKFDAIYDWEEAKDDSTVCCNKPLIQTVTCWPSRTMNGVFSEDTIDLAMMYFES